MAGSEPNSDILRHGFDEFARFINPGIADRARLAGEPVRMIRADDGMLVDAHGNRVEDLHGTQAFGHRNPEVASAVRAFLDSDAPSWFPSRVNPFAGRLARRLCERTGYARAFFAHSGSGAVEAALKLARAATRRPRILGLRGAYHGCTFGSLALMDRGPFRDPFGPHLPGTQSLPFGDVDALHEEMGPDVAAVIVEPIQLEGGVRALPGAYTEALCELTERHGALLVADEVQTGLGRTGRFLASESWPRRPDAALLGKHLGGGLAPISAMLTRDELWHRAYGADFETAEGHNSTFSGSPLCAVAALAALDILTDDLMDSARRKGEAFRSRLAGSLGGMPILDELRGAGLIVGIALRPLDHPWLSFDSLGLPDLEGRESVGLLLCHRLYRRGFIAFVCGHDWRVLRLQPRLAIPESRLDELADIIAEEAEKLGALN